MVCLMEVDALAECVAQVIRSVKAVRSYAGTQVSILQDVTQASITICTLPQ